MDTRKHRSSKLDGPIVIPRPVLLEILLAKLSTNCTIHTSKRLTNYEPEANGSITLHFVDGSTARADVLVGADGVRSPTRATMFKRLASHADPAKAGQYMSHIEPKFSGFLVYRSPVDVKKFKEQYPGHQAFTQTKIVSSLCLWIVYHLNFSGLCCGCKWCGKNQVILWKIIGLSVNHDSVPARCVSPLW